MPNLKALRAAVLPFALLAVLLLTAAAGDIWHHHHYSSRTSCQICHLGQQPVDTPVFGHKAPAPEPLGAMLGAEEKDYLLSPFSPRTPTRAPPSF
jgi:hypothetical protein